MNHYPRHIGDYLKKTIGLTMQQDGAYGRMIDLYYGDEKPLPVDKEEIYTSTRCRSKSDQGAVDYVLTKYFTKENDGYHHKRCDEELAKFADKSAKASNSASKRWDRSHREGNANAPPNAMRTHSEGNASQEPVTSNQEPEVQEQSANAPQAPKSPRAKRLHDGWELPPEWLEWAQIERPEWGEKTVILVSLKFRDYWLGKGVARANWLATWRNWVRNESLQERKNGNHNKTLSERRSDNIADITGRKNAGRTIDSDRVDGTAVRENGGDLRESPSDNVGRLSQN